MDGDDGMARLMIGGHLLFIVGHDHGAALAAHHDLVLGGLELVHGDQTLAPASGHQSRFVDEVRKVGAGETGRAPRNRARRSEEHTSELQSLMRISYAVSCLKKKNDSIRPINNEDTPS